MQRVHLSAWINFKRFSSLLLIVFLGITLSLLGREIALHRMSHNIFVKSLRSRFPLLGPSGAQSVTVSVCPSLWPKALSSSQFLSFWLGSSTVLSALSQAHTLVFIKQSLEPLKYHGSSLSASAPFLDQSDLSIDLNSQSQVVQTRMEAVCCTLVAEVQSEPKILRLVP